MGIEFKCAVCGSKDVHDLDRVGTRGGKYGQHEELLIQSGDGVISRSPKGVPLKAKICLRCKHVMLFSAE